MNEILGVQIPADLTALSPDELRTLRSDLKAAASTALSGDVTPTVIADVKQAREAREYLGAMLTQYQEAEVALAAELEAERAALASEDEETAETTEGDGPEDGDDDEGDGETEAEGDGEGAAAEGALVASAGWSPTVRAGDLAPTSGTGGGTATLVRPDAVIPPAATTLSDLMATGHVRASSGLREAAAGEQFADMGSLADALQSRYQDIAGGSTERVMVARIPAAYAATQILGEDKEDNIKVLGGRDFRGASAQRAITAAMCAPVEPYYGLGAMSSTARPMRASMASYRAPRGGVTVYPTPRLSDIDNGVGIWTRANDADANATKEACAVITCSSSTQYDIYAIYRCLTVKNLLQLTFPELVEAYLNRLAALQARLAEETLLDAMVASVNAKSVTVAGSGLDASIDLWTTIENAICVYREEERYETEVLEFRAHRWLRSAIKIGLMRQRRTSGRLADRLPTDAEVDAAFRNLGVEPTWTLDYASTWTQVPAQADGEQLSQLPQTADFNLQARGNLRYLDEGNINLGVTNNVVRDNTSNTKNQFSMWWENVEGLIDFGAISYNVTITDFCPNGAQTGDIEPVECTGPTS